MQGKKTYTPKLLYQIHLNGLVPADNFYRKLDSALDLGFLYQETASYYGAEGQESIDPVVFFKLCLVGYLNNLCSDRRIIEYCSNCLDVRLYLKYDIDEQLPWHSTISRTRQLYGEKVFLSLFQKVLGLCIERGMVRGKRQAIDSAFVKANASMDSLQERAVLEDGEAYCQELNEESEHKAPEVKGKPQGTKNRTHYSPTDEDARISTKPGKPTSLNYYGQVAVDDAHHVITGALADYADQRDSQCLPAILDQTIENLQQHGVMVEQVVADTGYSSAEALRHCSKRGVEAFIPNIGLYKPSREGFVYDAIRGGYQCTRGNRAMLEFKNISKDKNEHSRREYRSSATVCGSCPLKEECIGKSSSKKLTDSLDKPIYDQMHEKMQTSYAKRMSRIRKSTVEPVLGSLVGYYGMKKTNARGIKQASKHVLMAALCYNLRKYLKYAVLTRKTAALSINQQHNEAIGVHWTLYSAIKWLISGNLSTATVFLK